MLAGENPEFWTDIMLQVSEIDYGQTIPELTERFLSIWSKHYAIIGSLTKPKAPILEIGAGFGVLAAGLGRITGGPIWATEHPSRTYLFSPDYRKFLKNCGVCLIAQDLREGLPFCSQSLPLIYFCDVIEHLLPADIMTVLSEISRVLVPGGELVLSTPTLNRFSNFVRFVKGHTINPPLEVQRVGATYGHIREMAPEEVQMLLPHFGFEPIKRDFGLNPYYTDKAFGQYNIFSPKAVNIINQITGLTARFFPSVSDGLYVLARRRDS